MEKQLLLYVQGLLGLSCMQLGPDSQEKKCKEKCKEKWVLVA